MIKDKELSAIVANVHSTLEANYSGISLGVLAEQSKNIERDIENLTVQLIYEYFSITDDCSKNHYFKQFAVNSNLYEIKSGARIKDPILEIWILDAIDKNIEFTSGGKSIFGVGYYQSFEIHIPKKLTSHIGELESLVHAVYLSSYRWMEECLFNNLAKLEKGFTQKLYGFLRTYLDNKGKVYLAEKIWFSIFSEKDGYYSLDSKAVTEVLKTLKKRNFNSEFSPIYHVAKLIGLEMPYQKSFSKISIETNGYKDFQLNKAAYISDMSHIYKTEEQMVENGGYAIFPITTIGNRKLVASFPATLKNEICPILEVINDDLSSLYKKETKLMAKHITKIKSSYNRMSYSELGSFCGGLFAVGSKGL